MSNFEGILACVDLIDFSFFLLVKIESEFILFFCSKSKSKLLDVLNKVLFKEAKLFLSILTFVVFKSSKCGSFTK